MRYSARHVWIRLLSNGMVRCGLDAFAAALLPDDCQIVILANHSYVREGDEFGWVYGGNRTLPLSAPVSGTIVCRNTELLSTAQSVRQSPYEKGCVLTISPVMGALATARLSSPRNHMRRIRKRGRTLSSQIQRILQSPDLGPCLNDGGTPITRLNDLLGDDRYWAMLQKFVGGD